MNVADSYQAGYKVDYTPSSAVAVGDAVMLNDLLAVAERPIPANKLGAVAVKGVFKIPKAAGAIGQGAIVYWDAANSNITTTSSGNKRAGKAAEAAASGDATVKVLINIG